MRRKQRLSLATMSFLSLAFLVSHVRAESFKVDIPFSLGRAGKPAEWTLVAKRSATHHIVLSVEPLKADPGVSDAVPVGARAYACRNRRRSKAYNDTGWKTGLGRVILDVHVRRGELVVLSYSTSAPLGARGVLQITAR